MSKTIGRPPKLITQTAERIQKDWLATVEPGKRLPGERVLAQQYGVSRPTIRGALAFLERELVLMRRVKAGRYAGHFVHVRDYFFRGKEMGVSFAKASEALRDSWNVEILGGICSKLHHAEMNLMMPTFDWRYLNNCSADMFFRNPAVSGIILIGRHAPEVLQSIKCVNRPMAAVDTDAAVDGLDSFFTDDFAAGELLAKRLHLLGHQRIAAAFESPKKPAEKQDEAWRRRREGFTAGWAKTGNHAPQFVWVENRGSSAEVLPALKELLKKTPQARPTAVVTAWGGLPAELRPVAADVGVQIPRDLTVVGFCGQTEVPELTAVRFDGGELGRLAVDQLLQIICNRRPPSTKPEIVRIKGRYVAATTHAHAPD
jgi:DNA-binding LacI/PurR family transcriptional regulator